MLKGRDPTLHTYLVNVRLEPQIFLLRWLRLLFGREFPLDETLIMWDALFAYQPRQSLELVDFMAIALITDIRDELLAQDSNGVLSLLFKYPVSHKVGYYVQLAINLTQPQALTTSYAAASKTPGVSSLTPNISSNSAKSPKQDSKLSYYLPSGLANVVQKGSEQIKGAVKSVKHSLNSSSGSASHREDYASMTTTSSTLSQGELEKLRELHLNISSRIDIITGRLQSALYAAEVLPHLPDDVLMALAELKQIKDVLNGYLPIELLPPITGLVLAAPNVPKPKSDE
jgi:hypothetical protein